MKRKNPHARSRSLWPGDLCAQLYQEIQKKRMEKGKLVPLTYHCRVAIRSSESSPWSSDTRRRWIDKMDSAFRIDSQGNQLKAWVEYPSGKIIGNTGERDVEKMPLTEFSVVYPCEEKTVLNLLPSRLRKALGVGSFVAGIEYVKDADEKISAEEWMEWIPDLPEVAISLGIAAAFLVEKCAFVYMKSDEKSIELVVSMPQVAFYIMDEMLQNPNWKWEAPPHLSGKKPCSVETSPN